MTAIPPAVLKAIQASTSQITRRVEIYQADGETIWDPEGDDEYTPRMVDGSITVDYNRDERRSGDFSLDNRDKRLRPEPHHGFWYDKIIKPYRGIKYPTSTAPPAIVVVDAPSSTLAYQIRGVLASLGFDNTDVRLGVASISAVKDYDIFVSYNPTGAAISDTVIKQAFDTGKGVMTFGNQYGSANLPFVTATGAVVTKNVNLNPSTMDSPLAGGWVAQTTTAPDSTLLLTALSARAIPVATDLEGATTHYTAIVADSDAGGRWFHFAPHQIQSQGKILVQKAVEWLIDWKPTSEWEMQIGEFMIDTINEARRPKLVKVGVRDYVKKMMLSKVEKSMSFPAGTPLITLVKSLAANAGIFKYRINVNSNGIELTLPNRVDIERGTPRWQICKDACTQNSIELFFDNEGYLVMRNFIDPSFGPIAHTFKTGKISDGGNLVDYERSTDDSRLFNHIIVVGERENDTLLPFFAEVKNTNTASPTNIARIGDRLMDPVIGTYFTSNEQCAATAHNLMKVAALESYNISFSSIVYQWLEAGSIVRFLDPDALPTDPDRFLLDSFVIPMTLGPMTGTGKRVTLVLDESYVALTSDVVNML